MGIVDALRDGGFKPKASQEGIWDPYKGTYKVSWDICRMDIDQKNGNVRFIQAEWNIRETVEGDQKRESKYSDFRKRYYVEGENAEKNLKQFLSDAFTFGVDCDITSDESLQMSFGQLIGREGYLRAWGWKPEGRDNAVQMTVIMQEKAALKKKKADSVPF